MIHYHDVFGYFSDFDQIDYEHLVNALPDNAFIVEVGCNRGKSLISIGPTIIRKNIRIMVVDIFDKVEPEPGYNEPGVTLQKQNMYEDFRRNMGLANLLDRTHIHIGPSVQGAKACADLGWTPDLVFLDADHSYEGVKADIEAWLPLVKINGVLSGHDYDHNGRSWPGVHKAVHEKFGQPYFGVYIWAIRKLNDGKFETQSFIN